MKKEILLIRDLKTTQNDKIKLDQFNLQLCESEIIGLIFEKSVSINGFIHFLKGESQIVAGKIFYNEKQIRASGINRILKGASIIDTDTNLIHTINLVENLLLTSYGFLALKNTGLKKCEEVLRILELDIPLDTRISDLKTFEIILVKMVKAYIDNRKIIILSDIAKNINHNELDVIYKLIKKLQSLGFSFIIIETFQDVMIEWANLIYFIKRGKTIGVLDPKRDNLNLFYENLYKRKQDRNKPAGNLTIKDQIDDKRPVLILKDIKARGIQDLSFSVERGEIIKLFFPKHEQGLEFFSLFTGQNNYTDGAILLNGKTFKSDSYKYSLDNGVALINSNSEDYELLYNMTVIDNLGIILSNKMDGVWRNSKYLKSLEDFIDENIQPGISCSKVRDLSPDLIIKLTYTRWLLFRPKTLFILNPLIEIDINLQRLAIDMINHLHKNNITIVIILTNYSSIEKLPGDTIYMEGPDKI